VAALSIIGTAIAGYIKYTPIDNVTITSPSDGAIVFAGGKYPATCTTSEDDDCDTTTQEIVPDGVAHNWSGAGSFDPTAGTSVTWTAPCADGSATITVTASDNGSPTYANDSDKSDSVTVTVYSTIYVDVNATGGNNNGTSWANAFTDLQDALDESSSCSEVWVAEGTYKPQDSNGFYAGYGLNLYGGFDGTETSRSQRDWTSNETILSGDIGNVNDPNDNATSVLVAISSDGTVIDGFTITKGRGDGTT
jgi:hypothetical protein